MFLRPWGGPDVDEVGHGAGRRDRVDAGNLRERIRDMRCGVVAVHRLEFSRHVPLLIWPARHRPACGLVAQRAGWYCRGEVGGTKRVRRCGSDLLCEQKYLSDISSPRAPTRRQPHRAGRARLIPVGRRGTCIFVMGFLRAAPTFYIIGCGKQRRSLYDAELPLTRRAFVAGTAALAAGGALTLAGCSVEQPIEPGPHRADPGRRTTRPPSPWPRRAAWPERSRPPWPTRGAIRTPSARAPASFSRPAGTSSRGSTS